MPSTLTQSSDVILVLESNNNSTGANDEDDNIINWNLSGLAYMPLLLNHSMAWLQSDCKFDNTSDNGAEYEIVLSSA